ncbi:MAG: heavy-metal-associated domain-containing protein [Bacteroidales bacterium]|nr:heavy-metal-associated domain-containing protein [Bacteroidales bacterium]MDE5955073.1 heavy-metal-associated domain-containing protein [Bacteroidales bacterium]
MKLAKTIIIAAASLMAFAAVPATANSSVTSEMSVLTDKKPAKKAKAEIRDVHFHVHLHCANCVKKVQENIAFEKGVKDLKVSLEDQTVDIKYDASKTSEEALKSAIEALGYPVSEHGGAGHEHGHHHE